MTFLICVAVFVAIACVGLPLLLLGLFAVWDPEQEQLPATNEPVRAGGGPDDSASARGPAGTGARRIDFSRTTV